MAGGSDDKGVEVTPTWAVAGVCAFIILISFALEKALHAIGTWLTKRHKRALYEALEKIKEELMILGFISLFLSFTEGYIAKICIPYKLADRMLPCGRKDEGKSHRRLLLNERRALAAGGSGHECVANSVPLISITAAHQLHILIFFLASFHVFYSIATVFLGKLKIRGWKEWENETLSADYEWRTGTSILYLIFRCNHFSEVCVRLSMISCYVIDPSRLRLTHQTSFVRAHNSFWTKIPIFFYVGCFFRQFFTSVTRADYLTLRNGFITTHLAPNSQFDFQKYIKRSLEDDFKRVVGVSPALWAYFVVFLLLNLKGWNTLFWASSILPFIVILAVGTNLQAILTKMALEITERHSMIQGIPLVQCSDNHFWFSRPQLILRLLHFALFLNAFKITYVFWTLYEFGTDSCLHDKIGYMLIKTIIGVGALVLCSYSTLPLYALVTQMGSHMKQAVFDEQTREALKKWHMAVKDKKQKDNTKKPVTTQTLGGKSIRPISSTRRYSVGRTLHRFMTTGHSAHLPPYAELHVSNFEGDEESSQANLTGRVDDDIHRDNEMTVLPTEKQEDDLLGSGKPSLV